MTKSHTIIVGAGIIGASAAYYLARRGHRVTLLDRGEVAAEASGGNAGIVAVGHPPLPRPGVVRKTLRGLMNPSNPLYIPLRWTPGLLRWLWRFRRACTQAQFERSMKVLAAMGWQTIECFDTIVAEEHLECEYHRTGWLEIYRTQQGRRAGHREAALLRRFDVEAVELNGDELREQQPAFAEDVIGAMHYRDSAFADPHRFVLEVTGRARQHGAELRQNAEVTMIERDNDCFAAVRIASGERIEGDCLVVAGGIWSSQLLKTIGVNVPMQAAKGYHVQVPAPEPSVSTVCVLAERFIAVTPIQGGLRLAGTLELSGINHRMVQRRLDMLTIGARPYLPALNGVTPATTWCGLRPCTADGLPVVGWAPAVQGVYVATGHAMMGFALGPVTGKLICEDVLDGSTSIDITELRVDRF